MMMMMMILNAARTFHFAFVTYSIKLLLNYC